MDRKVKAALLAPRDPDPLAAIVLTLAIILPFLAAKLLGIPFC